MSNCVLCGKPSESASLCESPECPAFLEAMEEKYSNPWAIKCNSCGRFLNHKTMICTPIYQHLDWVADRFECPSCDEKRKTRP